MQIIVRPTFNQKTLNKVFHIGAMIICIGLIGSHPVEYKRFYNDRWRIELHERDSLMLQAKNCPNRKIRENSALYMFRRTYKDHVIVVKDDDRVTPQLIRNTVFSTPILRQNIVDGKGMISDSGMLYRGFPVFIDSEEELLEAKKIFLFFEESKERWLLKALEE